MRHQDIDRRSIALHQAVAEKLRQDPSLLAIALANLDSWETRGAGHAQPYLEAWRQIIGSGVDHCLQVMVEDSERSTALRQSSPFAGVLTDAERLAIFQAFRDDRVPTGAT